MSDRKPDWTCGMCRFVNVARNRSRCKRCGAVKGFGIAPAVASMVDAALAQYERFKRRHPECILLFRIGDFYEAFGDDARTMHKALGLTLTERPGGIPMAGVPHHQLETYLRRLIQQGFRVAVCEEVEKARTEKAVRAVTRVLDPDCATAPVPTAPERSPIEPANGELFPEQIPLFH